MARSFYLRIAIGVALSAGCLLLPPQGRADERGSSSRLIESYDAAYQDFVDRFRASKETDQRVALVKQATAKINKLFAEHLKDPDFKEVLPKLVNARLVDLEPTFVEVIDNHPDRETRALALLCFAKYSGNNGREKTCTAALAFLKRRHGDVPYRDSTFAKAADESLYFFTHLAVGRTAPPTVGKDVDEALFRLADYRGKVVMLRFWGNWCPACRRMFGFERELVKKYKNQPFALVGVNSDSREECRRAQREANLTWRSMWDGGTTRGPISRIYRVEQWPTIVVIDAQGVIRYRTQGFAEPQLSEILARLIREAHQQAAVDTGDSATDAGVEARDSSAVGESE